MSYRVVYTKSAYKDIKRLDTVVKRRIKKAVEKNLKSLREFLHRFDRETNQGEVVFESAGEFFRIREYDSK